MIEEGLLQRIEDAVPALAGNVYPLHRQGDKNLPALIYQRLGTERDLVAGSSQRGRLVKTRFQLNIYATTYSQLVTLRLEVAHALFGFYGDLGNGAQAYGADVEGDDEEFNSELNLYGGSLELTLWHLEE